MHTRMFYIYLLTSPLFVNFIWRVKESKINFTLSHFESESLSLETNHLV